ncbi:MAG: hypothetical protein L6300_12510 [Syntrophaceae bacterium]|nr:hypothetical protein [Syntrophaceae bacterium]
MFRNQAAGVETSRRFALMGMEEVGAPLGADGPAKAGVMICAACRADDHQGGGGKQSAKLAHKASRERRSGATLAAATAERKELSHPRGASGGNKSRRS